MDNISVKILKIDLRSYCVQIMCVKLVRLYVVTWQQRGGPWVVPHSQYYTHQFTFTGRKNG